MKITRQKLRNIIKEEQQKILVEMQDYGHPDYPALPENEPVWTGETSGGITMTLFANGTVYMETDGKVDLSSGRRVPDVLLEFEKSEISEIIENLQAMLMA